MWNDQQRAFAEAWGAALLRMAEGAFSRGTVRDVVCWETPKYHQGAGDGYSRLDCAFVGNPLKVAKAFGYLDAEWSMRSAPIAFAMRRELHAPRCAEDISRDGTVSLPDLLDRLQGQAAYEFAERDFADELPFTELSLRLLMEPGYPWPDSVDFDGPFMYWSAKSRRMIDAERPEWLIEVEERSSGKQTLGVNPCLVFPAREPERIWPVWGQISARGEAETLIVAHSMELSEGVGHHKQFDQAVANIRACGGLLFPSLSIGPIPASNFGPISLIAHLGLVIEGLKPYRGRGEQPPSWVYANDAWTSGTGEFMSAVAIRLFDELHGHEDWTYDHHVWTLGPPAELFGGPEGGNTPLDTTRQLATAIKRRRAHFKRAMTAAQFEAVRQQIAGTGEQYAYSEAKARTVIALAEFPYMIGPDSLGSRMRAFAKALGYRGKLVELPDTLGVAKASERPTEQHDYIMYQWAWKVADAVKALQDPMEITT